MEKPTVDDVDVKSKRILMRVDFNVPLRSGRVSDGTRIRAALQTIESITHGGGRLVLMLMSHLGQPAGHHVPEMSLKPCVSALSTLIGKPVSLAEYPIFPPGGGASLELMEGRSLPGVAALTDKHGKNAQNIHCHKYGYEA